MLPLQRKRIMVTREAEAASDMTYLIEQQGGISIEIPLIHFRGIDSKENDLVLQQMEQYDWIFFTSATGVKFFFEGLNKWNISTKVLKNKRFAVVGSKTAKALQSHGFSAEMVPDTFLGTSLGIGFNARAQHRYRILVIQGNLARQDVVKELQPYHNVQTVIMYETVVNVKIKEKLQVAIEQSTCDLLTFTSPSTVHAFVSLLEEKWSERTASLPCICIGSTTKQSALEHGFSQVMMPKTFTIESMIEVAATYFNKKGQCT
ncbi:uroporphyrinogen-III synthase [Pontibacillus litoralis]|uniref:Uroporphyrinogen-III synthase n=1 Tax=Pontibacillus litoralis JSM 072002 TaxID=1385512 RepID=A0A0A5GAZ6_9BACI|nr:uroporphyrinogen-III synthase [Pontibacillus litoralis]KGX89204.1 hypothetical protein N784_01455 [Pontibacillus litoralis JSM 072002]